MVPLKVSFCFSAPVLMDSEYPVHLDAILSYGLMKEAEEMGSPDPWAESLDLSNIIDRTSEERWVWKASQLLFVSAMMPVGSTHMMTNMVRQSDPESTYNSLGLYWEPGRKTGPAWKIDTRSGRQRGYQWLTSSRWIVSATGWCIGDPDAVSHYLRYIEYIGKQGRNGYGRISGRTIEPVKSEAENEKWKIRCLPDTMAGHPDISYEPAMVTLRPPYWRRTERELAVVPIV